MLGPYRTQLRRRRAYLASRTPPRSLSRLAKASMGPERSNGGGACATMRAGELSPDEEA